MIEAIRKYYANLSDIRLATIAKEESLFLTAEGLQVLKEEIIKRQLPLLDVVENVFREEERLQELIRDKCDEIRDQSCPICGSEEYKLNAIRLTTVTSFLVTSIKQQLHIGCYNCLMTLKQEVEDKTSLLGWWGLWGLFETPKALKSNDRGAEELKEDKPSSGLLAYVSDLVRNQH